MAITPALLSCAATFEAWMKDECLPLWAERGIDKATGGHYEQLDATGLPNLRAHNRVRVQARQVFSYAYAYSKGWLPVGADMANELLHFMASHAVHPIAQQGFVHLMDARFNVVDTRQDLYDHAFVFLAYAAVYKATGCKAVLQAATQLLGYWDEQFGSIAGGWSEGDYDASHRRQNPHMHLFEAFMSLYECSNDARWLARASEIFALFQTRFFDAKRGVVLEYFDHDWQPYTAVLGTQIEPDHMMEWVWLLCWYQRLSGHDMKRYTQPLYAQALQLGFYGQSKLMFDFVYIDSEATVTLHSGTKRCWPTTELIKAHIAQARAGDSQAEKLAVEAIEQLFTYFINAETVGGYCDQRGENNEVINANIAASTLYHLIVACGEVAQYCSDMSAQ